MADYAILPKLGLTMEEGMITGILKKIGEPVFKGDPIAVFETDKITADVESPTDGILLALYVKVDDVVTVLSPIALIGRPGENENIKV